MPPVDLKIEYDHCVAISSEEAFSPALTPRSKVSPCGPGDNTCRNEFSDAAGKLASRPPISQNQSHHLSPTHADKTANASAAPINRDVKPHRRHHSERLVLPRSVQSKNRHRRSASSPAATSTPEPTYSNQNDQEATLDVLFDRLHKLKSCIGGENDQKYPRIAQIWNNIGNRHFKKCELGYALAAYVEALHSYTSCFGENHPTIAFTLNNIGNAYLRLGQHDSALECMEKSKEILQNSLGGNHLETAKALHNLGQILCFREDYEEAMKVLQTALSVRRGQLGNSHVEVARTISLIGTVHLRKGELTEALTNHQDALRLKRCLLGDQHPSVAVSLLDVAHVQQKKGDLNRAIGSYKEALFVQKSIVCNGHATGDSASVEDVTDVGVTYHTIGNVYKQMGELRQSMGAFREACSMYQKAGLSDDHRCVVTLKRSIEEVTDTTYSRTCSA